MCFCTAILLAGGSGKRMGTDKPKQFLEVGGKPLIWYSLNTLQKSEIVDECILVVQEKDIPYVKESIVEAEGFSKVKAVTAGGRERFESVWKGLQSLKKRSERVDSDSRMVLIHDGARPLLTEKMLQSCLAETVKYGACVAAVPSKDTIAVADEEGFEAEIPNRRYVWSVQTPQMFREELLMSAFERMAEELEQAGGIERLSWITDDASVVRHYARARVRLVQGDYRNIKVTTEEDLHIVERFLKEASLFDK